jgi:hypothetical protein
MWRKEHFWNFSVLQRVAYTFLILLDYHFAVSYVYFIVRLMNFISAAVILFFFLVLCCPGFTTTRGGKANMLQRLLG